MTVYVQSPVVADSTVESSPASHPAERRDRPWSRWWRGVADAWWSVALIELPNTDGEESQWYCWVSTSPTAWHVAHLGPTPRHRTAHPGTPRAEPISPNVGGHGILRVGTIGAFIREQRQQAPASLRQLSRLAGVSNPYLARIEGGLRKLSADILHQIARGLRISAEQLYLRAGIVQDRRSSSEPIGAILTNTTLTERQKSVLVEIYESFHRENQAHQTGGSASSSPTDPHQGRS
jgi:transcriptional regulator with XRE-family HTH domain